MKKIQTRIVWLEGQAAILKGELFVQPAHGDQITAVRKMITLVQWASLLNRLPVPRRQLCQLQPTLGSSQRVVNLERLQVHLGRFLNSLFFWPQADLSLERRTGAHPKVGQREIGIKIN